MAKYYDERINPNALNIYICQACGGHIVTKDVVDGVTPFMLQCKCTSECTGHMHSSMYRVFDPEGKLKWDHEWYRPVIMNPSWGPATIDHINRGGLMLRRRIDNVGRTDVGAFTHRHVKTGGQYRVIAEGRLQASDLFRDERPGDNVSADMMLMTIYQAEDGSWWVRPTDEFNDGRFEVINAERS